MEDGDHATKLPLQLQNSTTVFPNNEPGVEGPETLRIGCVNNHHPWALLVSVPRRSTVGEGIYNMDWPSAVMPCLLNVKDCQVI